MGFLLHGASWGAVRRRGETASTRPPHGVTAPLNGSPNQPGVWPEPTRFGILAIRAVGRGRSTKSSRGQEGLLLHAGQGSGANDWHSDDGPGDPSAAVAETPRPTGMTHEKQGGTEG